MADNSPPLENFADTGFRQLQYIHRHVRNLLLLVMVVMMPIHWWIMPELTPWLAQTTGLSERILSTFIHSLAPILILFVIWFFLGFLSHPVKNQIIQGFQNCLKRVSLLELNSQEMAELLKDRKSVV